jgi:hypothetical protein
MGANPGRASRSSGPGRSKSRGRRNPTQIYDSLPVDERLAFGRLGIGKAHIRTLEDLARARRMVRQTKRLRNQFPNPAADLDSPSAEQARELREGFSGQASEHYTVQDEPHVPAGDYTDLGEFIAVAVKPTSTGQTEVVQEISFPGRDLELISDPSGRQLYVVGTGQDLTEADLRVFTASERERVELGGCRAISYGMAKFGSEVPASARGEDARWDHKFGEEGGTCPRIWYDRKMRRLILDRATYRIEGAWIRN